MGNSSIKNKKISAGTNQEAINRKDYVTINARYSKESNLIVYYKTASL